MSDTESPLDQPFGDEAGPRADIGGPLSNLKAGGVQGYVAEIRCEISRPQCVPSAGDGIEVFFTAHRSGYIIPRGDLSSISRDLLFHRSGDAPGFVPPAEATPSSGGNEGKSGHTSH